MAAGLALARANVEGPNGAWSGVALMVRANTLTLTARTSRDPVLRVEGVTSVTRETKSKWVVESEQGTYIVSRIGGCGCGR